MKRKRRNYSAEFKSNVVLELLSGQHTLNELAEKHQIAPATLSGWHKQFQERAAEIFQRGPSEQERILEEKEHEIALLQQKVGQLVLERDWLKRKSDGIFDSGGTSRTRFSR
jgi:transposase